MRIKVKLQNNIQYQIQLNKKVIEETIQKSFKSLHRTKKCQWQMIHYLMKQHLTWDIKFRNSSTTYKKTFQLILLVISKHRKQLHKSSSQNKKEKTINLSTMDLSFQIKNMEPKEIKATCQHSFKNGHLCLIQKIPFHKTNSMDQRQINNYHIFKINQFTTTKDTLQHFNHQ